MNAPACPKCGAPCKLKRNVIRNGTSQVFWYCIRCERIHPFQFLKHEYVSELLAHWHRTIADVPILTDYSTGTACAVCGVQGVELHHWAPQALEAAFGDDWHLWPTVDLCKPHHDLWHKIVTPYLVKIRT